MDPSVQSNNNDKDLRKGGAGASDWGVSKYGGMNEQTSNAQGAIAVKGGQGNPLPKGGVGLTEAVVPVVLFLANNAVSKRLLSQNGLSSKNLRGGNVELPNGGDLANSIAVPAGLILANNYLGKSLRRRSKPFSGTRRLNFRNKNRASRGGKSRKSRG